MREAAQHLLEKNWRELSRGGSGLTCRTSRLVEKPVLRANSVRFLASIQCFKQAHVLPGGADRLGVLHAELALLALQNVFDDRLGLGDSTARFEQQRPGAGDDGHIGMLF